MSLKYTPYHLHIGAHEVYPNLLDTVANQLTDQLVQAKTYMVSADDFRTKVRPFMMDASSGVQHVSELGLSNSQDRVVISAHGILCSKNSVMTKTGLYAECDKTLHRIRKFFSGEQVSLHFITPPQHDYALIADNVDQEKSSVSWMPIIEKLSSTFPEASLTIWPIERQELDSIEFCASILNIDLGRPHRKWLEKIAGKQRFARSRLSQSAHNSHRAQEISAYLDQIFHDDIEDVISDRIAHIGIKRVRDEFSIS